MPTSLVLTGDHVMKITAEPDVYKQAPFLFPMRDSALKLHARFGKHCSACMRGSYIKASRALGAALGTLIMTEAAKQPNQLPAFRAAICSVLKEPCDQIVVVYVVNGKKQQLAF